MLFIVKIFIIDKPLVRRRERNIINIRKENDNLYRFYKHQKDTEKILAKTLCQ